MTANKQILVSLVVFSGVMTGLLTFSSGVFDTYDSDIDESEQFEEFQDLAEHVDTNTSSQISSGREHASGLGADIQSGVFVLTGVYQIIRMSLDAFTLVPSIVSMFVSELGLPMWTQSVVISLITIALLFGIVAFYRGVS